MKQQNKTCRTIFKDFRSTRLRFEHLEKQPDRRRTQSRTYHRNSIPLSMKSKSINLINRSLRQNCTLITRKTIQRQTSRAHQSQNSRRSSHQKQEKCSSCLKTSNVQMKAQVLQNQPRNGVQISFLLRKLEKPSSKRQTKQFIGAMKVISQSISQQKLYQRLCIYSKQTSRSSLRMYKEDFQKMITLRYGKDRITQFLDMQYIEDYSSITRTLSSLANFTQEQVNVFIFLIMDQNRDGLITPSDLINFVGIKVENTETNFLIMQDLTDIINSVKFKNEQNQNVFDTLSDQYNYLLDESLTLMKLRVLNFEKGKKLRERENMQRRSKLRCDRSYQMFYTLKNYNPCNSKQKPVNKKIQSLVNLIFKNQRRILGLQSELSELSFAINFESFISIFRNKIPKTFYDFMYMFGGIEVPGLVYPKIDTSVLIKAVSPKVERRRQSNLQKFSQAIKKMKSFNYNLLFNF